MHRRRFIKFITSFIPTLFFIPKRVFSKKNLLFFSSEDQFILPEKIRLRSKTLRVDDSFPLGLKWSHDYISLEDFTQAYHFGLYTNDEKRKSVLYLEKDRITFTADNTFKKLMIRCFKSP